MHYENGFSSPLSGGGGGRLSNCFKVANNFEITSEFGNWFCLVKFFLIFFIGYGRLSLHKWHIKHVPD